MTNDIEKIKAVGITESLKTSFYILLISTGSNVIFISASFVVNLVTAFSSLGAPDTTAFATGLSGILKSLLLFFGMGAVLLGVVDFTFLGKITAQKFLKDKRPILFFLVSWAVLIMADCIFSVTNSPAMALAAFIAFKSLVAFVTFRNLEKGLINRLQRRFANV